MPHIPLTVVDTLSFRHKLSSHLIILAARYWKLSLPLHNIASRVTYFITFNIGNAGMEDKHMLLLDKLEVEMNEFLKVKLSVCEGLDRRPESSSQSTCSYTRHNI